MRPWDFHVVRFVCWTPIFAIPVVVLVFGAPTEIRSVGGRTLAVLCGVTLVGVWYFWSSSWMEAKRATAIGRFVYLLPAVVPLSLLGAVLVRAALVRTPSGRVSDPSVGFLVIATVVSAVLLVLWVWRRWVARTARRLATALNRAAQ